MCILLKVNSSQYNTFDYQGQINDMVHYRYLLDKHLRKYKYDLL